MTKRNIIIGSTLFLLAFSFFSFGRTPVNADDILREAREARIKARRGHCEKIGEKIADCYAGDMQTCRALQESTAWFTDEYGETPELACSTDPDPKAFGHAQE